LHLFLLVKSPQSRSSSPPSSPPQLRFSMQFSFFLFHRQHPDSCLLHSFFVSISSQASSSSSSDVGPSSCEGSSSDVGGSSCEGSSPPPPPPSLVGTMDGEFVGKAIGAIGAVGGVGCRPKQRFGFVSEYPKQPTSQHISSFSGIGLFFCSSQYSALQPPSKDNP